MKNCNLKIEMKTYADITLLRLYKIYDEYTSWAEYQTIVNYVQEQI